VTILFRRSAARHGISMDRAVFVIRNCPCPLYAPDEGTGWHDQVMFLGADGAGVLLEVVGIELENGDLVVIHAMRMRSRFRAAYGQVMRCR
jgi:hypothetical protein